MCVLPAPSGSSEHLKASSAWKDKKGNVSCHGSNHIGIILDFSSPNQNRFRLLQYKYSLKPAKVKNKTQYYPFLDDPLNRQTWPQSLMLNRRKKKSFIML